MNKDADRHVVASEPGRAMAAAAAGRPSSTVPNARPSQEVTVSAWTFEIICSVFGAICLAVIIVLLCAFDHRQQPQWPMGVTINSVVAFLATLCRSAFMVPVAEGISQMKWNLFATERPRPLSDLVAVDEASRGIWGTTKLLSLSLGRYRPYTILVFLLATSSFLSSTITQSVIKITSLPDNSTDAFVAASGTPVGLGIDGLVAEITTATQVGIATPQHRRIPAPEPICASPLCDYPVFSTLGVCAEVRNVTRHLSFAAPDTTDSGELYDMFRPQWLNGSAVPAAVIDPKSQRNASLPTGAYLVGGPEFFNMNISVASHASTTTWDRGWLFRNSSASTVSFGDQPDLLQAGIINFFVIWRNTAVDGHDGKHRSQHSLDRAFQASEVLLHFCVKTLKVAVSQGNSTTETLAVETNVKMINGTRSWRYPLPSAIHNISVPRIPGIGSDAPEIPASLTNVTDSDVVGALRNLAALLISPPTVSDNGTIASTNLTILKTSQVEPAEFVIGEGLFMSMFHYLRRTLKGTFGGDKRMEIGGKTLCSETFGTSFWSSSSETLDAEFDMLEKGGPIPMWTGMVQNITRNIADSLTNAMRTGLLSSSPVVLGSGEGTTRVSGTAYHSNFVVVHWPFITLLAAQVVLSAVALAWIIMQTRKLGVDVVKSELLPVLFGIDPDERRDALLDGRDEAVMRARNMAPRVVSNLEKGEDGWLLKPRPDQHRWDEAFIAHDLDSSTQETAPGPKREAIARVD